LGVLVFVVALVLLVYNDVGSEASLINGFRPPAVPLILNDPYMNIWSPSDNLTDSWSMLWDGSTRGIAGIIRIDGQAKRFMGPSGLVSHPLPAMNQMSVQVYPTRTVYIFQHGNSVRLTVTFTSPLLTDSYDILSRPVTYVSFLVESLDRKSHQVQLYFDSSGEICTNKADEYVVWKKLNTNSLAAMAMGTRDQQILKLAGDAVGINWGYFYIAAPKESNLSQSMNNAEMARSSFVTLGKLPDKDDQNMPRAANFGWIVLSNSWSFILSPDKPVTKMLILAYDDIASINYFGQIMKGYWTQTLPSAVHLLEQSFIDYGDITARCETFDQTLLDSLTKVGGNKFATIASLAYRQALGAMKLVWNSNTNTPWYFLKEISSDGDLSTVDVIFPAAPLLLYLNPELLLLQLMPIMAYANNETSNKYPYAFSPHHLGFYPVADINPSQQENMPVEETANMLLMLAAVSQRDKSRSLLKKYIYPKYWKLLQQWVDYLTQNLPDPSNQLCTDDFEGPSPHNANLAAKGILGVSSFALLCKEVGKLDESTKYMRIAKDYADIWELLALDYDSQHYRLELYSNNTFSLKYNILFQYILGVDVFTDMVMHRELNYYLQNKLNTFGVPLDNRADFTKLDWLYWIAAMGTNEQFSILNEKAYEMAHRTPQRVPLTDWYNTMNANMVGFKARPVVGGLYARMLLSPYHCNTHNCKM